jgi:predicted nucleic acid-binding protein
VIAVVDASVAAKWFLSGRPDEQHADLALHTPGAVLITADERYYNKARAEGQITLLADFSSDMGSGWLANQALSRNAKPGM